MISRVRSGAARTRRADVDRQAVDTMDALEVSQIEVAQLAGVSSGHLS